MSLTPSAVCPGPADAPGVYAQFRQSRKRRPSESARNDEKTATRTAATVRPPGSRSMRWALSHRRHLQVVSPGEAYSTAIPRSFSRSRMWSDNTPSCFARAAPRTSTRRSTKRPTSADAALGEESARPRTVVKVRKVICAGVSSTVFAPASREVLMARTRSKVVARAPAVPKSRYPIWIPSRATLPMNGVGIAASRS